MSSYLCFLCHNTVNAASNEELREKYKDVVGVHLCPDSHLCGLCGHLLQRLAAFKTACLKQSLEYPVLFSEKCAVNYQKTETELLIVCPEDDCQHYTSRNIFNYNHNHNEEYNDNNHYGSNEYAELEEENSDNENNEVDYIDFHKECDRTDKLFDNVSYNFNEETNVLHDNYNLNEDLNNELNLATNDEEYHKNNSITEFESNEQINDNIDDVYENHEFDDDQNHFNEQADTYHDNINEDINNEEKEITEPIGEEDPAKPKKKKKKDKKSKKKSYEKIVLSYKEQKAVLEGQRKSEKYLNAEFKCYNCGLGFLFKDTYQSHMMRHEESNGQFSCNVCGLRFATQNARCMHVILHSELYKCNKCGSSVKRPHRTRHARDCWRGGGVGGGCHLCGTTFKDAACLQQHLRRKHGGGGSGDGGGGRGARRGGACAACGEALGPPPQARAHMLKHINRRFSCPQCQSTFSSPYTLAQHAKTHAREPYAQEQFNCATCGTSYSTRKSLLAHFRNTLAHQQTSFPCPCCGRPCPSRRALSAHLSRHAPPAPPAPAPAPLPCPSCPASLPTRRALLRHARAHTAPPPPGMVCHLCGAKFKGKNKLTRHLKEVCERARVEEAMATFYEQTDMQT